MPTRGWAHLPALLLALPALAEPAPGPQVGVTLDPDTPVTVGTPVAVTATVLVPTWMPQPPAWPDLQIADAITRLPERATRPVTQRIGSETWSGVARTWQIVPQRAADFDLGAASVGVTYADPDTSAPVTASLDLPDITFSATLPPGAEGMDPFVAATGLTVAATVDGLPEAPKPGDAFTLTLRTEASGPPAMLLPPLARLIPTPAGLRAYPRQPALVDTPGDPPTAERTETIAYVIEAPGDYALPAISLDWWNTATATRETAATAPVSFRVPAPSDGQAAPRHPPLPLAGWLALGAAILAAAAFGIARLRRRPPHPPSQAARYRALRRAIRREPASAIRIRLTEWQSATSDQPAPTPKAVEGPLRDLERLAYGPSGNGQPERTLRRTLLARVAEMHASRPSPRETPLPALNPVPMRPG